MAKSDAVLQPNLGLYLGRSRLGSDARALRDGNNFRITKGKLSNLVLGWASFADFTLDGPVLLIKDFFLRDGTESLVFATDKSIYEYDGTSSVAFLNPRYATGTAAASGTAVTGTGTNWDPEASAGDFIHFGSATQTDPDATWFEIESVTNDTAIVLTADAGTVVDGPYTIRKSFSGDISNVWVTDVFYNASPSNDDELWMTNGVDYPVRWNGTDDQVEVMDSLGFDNCKVLGVYANMMIFADLVQSGTRKPTDIINSNTGEPQNTSSGLAEQFKVHGNFGEIYSLDTIGDALAIYSRYTVTLAQFVGGDLIFAFRQVISNQGAVGYRAVADFGDYHQFISADGLYSFDGTVIREIGDHVFRQVLSTLKHSNRTFTFHLFNDIYAELLWVVPQTTDTTDSPTTAYGEHYLEDTGSQQIKVPFSRRDFPFTSAGEFTRQDTLTWGDLVGTWAAQGFRWNDQFFAAAFPLTLVGDEAGNIFTLNTAQTQDDDPMESYVSFFRRPLFDGRIRGLLKRVYPFATTSDELEVTVEMSDAGEGPVRITDEQTFDATTDDPHFTVHYRRGRFYEITFGSTGSGWEISGYDIDKEPGGNR